MLAVRVTRIDSQNQKTKITDYVAQEKPLHIVVNRLQYTTIYCSPLDLKELALGHLLSEGILKSLQEIQDISLEGAICRIQLKKNIDAKRRLRLSRLFARAVLSTCGTSQPFHFTGKLPKVKSGLKIKAGIVSNCVMQLNHIAEIFRKTGGVHVAAIYERNGTLVAPAEDVGRHNAVDKVIGKAILNDATLSGCFLAISGRLSGEIALKAVRVGIPLVASLAAAMDSGITASKDTGLTLVGFVRGGRMNVYTFPERIIV